jgi:hypothetical protein
MQASVRQSRGGQAGSAPRGRCTAIERCGSCARTSSNSGAARSRPRARRQPSRPEPWLEPAEIRLEGRNERPRRPRRPGANRGDRTRTTRPTTTAARAASPTGGQVRDRNRRTDARGRGDHRQRVHPPPTTPSAGGSAAAVSHAHLRRAAFRMSGSFVRQADIVELVGREPNGLILGFRRPTRSIPPCELGDLLPRRAGRSPRTKPARRRRWSEAERGGPGLRARPVADAGGVPAFAWEGSRCLDGAARFCRGLPQVCGGRDVGRVFGVGAPGNGRTCGHGWGAFVWRESHRHSGQANRVASDVAVTRGGVEHELGRDAWCTLLPFGP